MIKVEQLSYHGWQRVYRVSNGSVELLAMADAGPRVLWYGFCNGENQFHEAPEDRGKTGGDQFRLYGGHRLWIAPEGDRTMHPDNVPVEVSIEARGLRLTAPVEGSGLQRILEIELAESGPDVRVVHNIQNHGAPTEAAPWAISVMKAGGLGIIPLPPRAPHGPGHLLPETSVALWSYTDLSDLRWNLGQTSIQLRQAPASGKFREQKIGLANFEGWLACHNRDQLFVKWAEWKQGPQAPGANFPDRGCNLEMFANSEFLELETLGPLRQLQTGATAVHVEHWSLIAGVPPGEGDEWLQGTVLPRIAAKQIFSRE